jgi:hypothetical protein
MWDRGLIEDTLRVFAWMTTVSTAILDEKFLIMTEHITEDNISNFL